MMLNIAFNPIHLVFFSSQTAMVCIQCIDIKLATPPPDEAREHFLNDYCD